eukprot:TRINITY_DN9987_c0_g2_i1.p1 TRINITY_DN9987_c0_g2~~TRINITY_DN9987_c0_g2_i1.p1  ORF type:complete len:511 (+),score=157.87 TRINITY_DN9987_c0_g2_i1:13-1545(+)
MATVDTARGENPREWPELLEACAKGKRQAKLTGGGRQIARLYPALLAPLQHLQSLQVSGTAIAEFPAACCAALPSLSELVLSGNKLTHLCPDVCKLRLQILMVDHNQLMALPDELGNLAATLQVLDVANNKLQALPTSVEKLANVVTLNLEHNELTEFPSAVLEMRKLSCLSLGYNQMKSLPDQLGALESLQTMRVDHNQLEELPGALLALDKHLRDASLGDNPYADKKFARLAASGNLKQVFAYLRKNATAPAAAAEVAAATASTTAAPPRIRVVFPPDASKAEIVGVTEHARQARRFIVVTKLVGLSFTDESLQRFIDLQTELHQEACDKRRLAAIGTHDLDAVKSPFTFDARPPDDIWFAPLFKPGKQRAASSLRRHFEKWHDVSMLKYLRLIEPLPRWPVLVDGAGQVMSLSPVINSAHSRISVNTTQMLIEVSSAVNLDVCRRVMALLLDRFSRDLPQLLVLAVPVANRESTVKYPSPSDVYDLLEGKLPRVPAGNGNSGKKPCC